MAAKPRRKAKPKSSKATRGPGHLDALYRVQSEIDSADGLTERAVEQYLVSVAIEQARDTISVAEAKLHQTIATSLFNGIRTGASRNEITELRQIRDDVTAAVERRGAIDTEIRHGANLGDNGSARE